MDIPKTRLFISYSHKDEPYATQLIAHLAALERAQLISCWHDRKIIPGQDWSQEIDTELERADIIMALVSSDFIASDYCFGVEMKTASSHHECGLSRLIPVIIRPVALAGSLFANIESLPDKARPVLEWGNIDSAWKSVVDGVLRTSNAIQVRKKAFLEKLIPGIIITWYDEHEKFLHLDQDSVIVRNIERLKQKSPEIADKLIRFVDTMQVNLNETSDRIWAVYGVLHLRSIRIPGLWQPLLLDLVEHVQTLVVAEGSILRDLESAKMDPALFGLPTVMQNFDTLTELLRLFPEYLNKGRQGFEELNDIVGRLHDIERREESKDFEKPEDH